MIIVLEILRTNQVRFSGGFTLIEILVMTVVMGTMITVGMSNIRRFEEKQRTVQAADTFVTELRGVQKKADAGEKPAACTGDLEGYRVVIGNGTNAAEVMAKCGSDVVVGTIVLSGGASFISDAGILFKSLGRGADLDGGGSSINLQLTGSASSYTVPISIGSGGTIKAGDVY